MFDKLFYLFLFFNIFFEICAQYLYKLFYNKKLFDLGLGFDFGFGNNIYIIVGVIFYAFTGYFTFKLLKYGELGVINIIWHLFHFFSLFLIGYFALGERLSLNKKIGCVFGIIALIFFMIDGHHH
tara:strand:+ start:61 stop:435 length:375 start_codon:yes stop_codon:yes gene_type:complete